MNATILRTVRLVVYVAIVGALVAFPPGATQGQGSEGLSDQPAAGVEPAYGPGWIMAKVKPLSAAALKTKAKNGVLAGPAVAALGSAALSETAQTPQITELARALSYKPSSIYDYVHNHIDYTPYWGSLKGATLTLLDGCGNDFDQASLMIALLQASGFSAQYVYGTMTIPAANLANWFGVDQTAAQSGLSSGMPAFSPHQPIPLIATEARPSTGYGCRRPSTRGLICSTRPSKLTLTVHKST